MNANLEHRPQNNETQFIALKKWHNKLNAENVDLVKKIDILQEKNKELILNNHDLKLKNKQFQEELECNIPNVSHVKQLVKAKQHFEKLHLKNENLKLENTKIHRANEQLVAKYEKIKDELEKSRSSIIELEKEFESISSKDEGEDD